MTPRDQRIQITTFEPAFDKRATDPAKNYGIHGVTLRMVLKGSDGAVQFILYTNWQLPHVTEEFKRRTFQAIGGDPHWAERPQPADLGYHSPIPHYANQATMGACEFLDGKPCYYDGSSLNAERIYETLLKEGSVGVWNALHDYYESTFFTPVGS